jgi:ppGpp synthetase/RelA/SpoT-type nucleotidyltranferase
MTPDVQSIRELWLQEEPLYRALVDHIIGVLEAGCKNAGVFAWVTGRPKEMASLLKKIIAKRKLYHELTDKAGVRVVVRFREDLKPAETMIERAFQVIGREDKIEKLGHNKVGYQAIHYDVVLPPETGEATLQNRQCEIQLRTLCQDLWADMDHELSYKPAAGEIASDVGRQINLLNALLELADRQFSTISELIKSGADPVLQLLTFLESHYYRFAARSYDPELAQSSVQLLWPLYGTQDVLKIESGITAFIDANRPKLSLIYDQYGRIGFPPVFLYQPELFLALHLLELDPFRLDERWCAAYPRSELEQVATMWGSPLD